MERENIVLKRYDAYQDSGVEWLGEIPSHWEVGRLKNYIELITGYPFKSDKYTDYGIKLARGINVCLLYTSPSPRDRTRSRMPSSA